MYMYCIVLIQYIPIHTVHVLYSVDTIHSYTHYTVHVQYSVDSIHYTHCTCTV